MIEIRKAVASDAKNILEYCKAVGAESDNLTFGEEGVSITLEKERDYLESILHSNKQLYLVAVDNNEIVGTAVFASFTKARLSHRAEISISVKKVMWGNHIGTRFMEQIIDFAKNTAGTEIISLEVRSDNERAIALYKRFGFEKIGTFNGFMKIYGTDVSCDIMRLSLSGK
jgi:RimJ/RimL family protein N-acetyltransferase